MKALGLQHRGLERNAQPLGQPLHQMRLLLHRDLDGVALLGHIDGMGSRCLAYKARQLHGRVGRLRAGFCWPAP
jgi:hypothetical protein